MLQNSWQTSKDDLLQRYNFLCLAGTLLMSLGPFEAVRSTMLQSDVILSLEVNAVCLQKHDADYHIVGPFDELHMIVARTKLGQWRHSRHDFWQCDFALPSCVTSPVVSRDILSASALSFIKPFKGKPQSCGLPRGSVYKKLYDVTEGQGNSAFEADYPIDYPEIYNEF